MDLSRGPMDGDGVYLGRGTQAEVEARIAGRLKTRVGADLGSLRQIAGLYLHAGAKAVAIGMRAYGFDGQPVAAFDGFIPQQKRRAIQYADQQILRAVIEEVG